MTGAAPVERLAPFTWMMEAGVVGVMAALGPGNARFVGGAVRDALLGRGVTDIDIATALTPEAVTERLEAAGIKTVPTGLAHGTVTAIVPGRAIEITSLRRDVETDGRHARIALIGDWDEDARRRDFTMNALYLDGDGNLYDPVGGRADLKAGRVRFVGDAAARIAEDVLRLLRFYRFSAHYGRGKPDAAARAACRKLATKVRRLSAERVRNELLKLLAAPDPLPALGMMAEDGVLAAIVPEANGQDRLRRLIAVEPEPDAIRRLAALIAVGPEGAAALAARLKLSNDALARLEALVMPAWPIDLAGNERRQRRALYHLGRTTYRDLVLMTGNRERAPALLAEAERMAVPVFPVKGGDAVALGVEAGPAVGKLLAELESWWEDEDFPDRAACLAELTKRLDRRPE
ncbi:MAG: CCA tRNA nucleotidyltransferase [Stellaceae bacterium]